MADKATKKIWQRDEVQSPCINICVIHPAERICTGCLRTIDEITQWSKYTPKERQDVMEQLADREGLLKKRRGGRKRNAARNE